MFPPTDHNLRQMEEAEGKKAKIYRIGRSLEHGLVHKTTSTDTIHIPAGCIHYVLTIEGGLIYAMDFLTPESAKALASVLLCEYEESDPAWRKEIFENFLRAVELGLENNKQIPATLAAWIKVQEAVREWTEVNRQWAAKACAIWGRFFETKRAKSAASCPCGSSQLAQGLEEHFRAEHMFPQFKRPQPTKRGRKRARPSSTN